MKKTLLSLFVCLAMACNASADLFTGGAGMTVSDANPGGLSSGVLTVVPAGNVVSFDNIIINVSAAHTWVGDVTLTLRSPLGTEVQVMRRPGTAGVGNSGDWLAGIHTFATAGTAIPNTGDMAAGTTWARSSNPASTQVIPPSNPNTFAAFNGESITGAWTLFALDSAGGDEGAIGSWSMNITTNAIPEPGSILLLSAFGLAGLVRRRRV